MANKKESGKVRRIFRSQDTGREVAEVPEAQLRGGGFLSSKDGGKLSDADFVARYATTDEIAGLAQLVKERRAARPRFSYWRCSNPKCRWEGKLSGDMTESVNCFRCNIMRIVEKDGGGWLQPMTAKEASAFEVKAADLDKKAVAQLKRARFAEINTARATRGNKPLTWEQFLVERRGG
jgi:hypothetical protein